jgi:hypothetical protein
VTYFDMLGVLLDSALVDEGSRELAHAALDVYAGEMIVILARGGAVTDMENAQHVARQKLIGSLAELVENPEERILADPDAWVSWKARPGQPEPIDRDQAGAAEGKPDVR